MNIRFLVRRDLPTVLSIDKLCFEYNWSEEDFIKCISQKHCTGVVIEEDRGHDETAVIGFMIYERYDTYINLVVVAVTPSHQKMGIGKKLIEERLFGKLFFEKINRITFNIRESNLDAQLFFKSLGFIATDVLKDFYDLNKEDAYSMEYRRPIEVEEFTS